MLDYIWISLGGALGTAGRFWMSGLVAQRFGQTFPLGTLKPPAHREDSATLDGPAAGDRDRGQRGKDQHLPPRDRRNDQQRTGDAGARESDSLPPQKAGVKNEHSKTQIRRDKEFPQTAFEPRL